MIKKVLTFFLLFIYTITNASPGFGMESLRSTLAASIHAEQVKETMTQAVPAAVAVEQRFFKAPDVPIFIGGSDETPRFKPTMVNIPRTRHISVHLASVALEGVTAILVMMAGLVSIASWHPVAGFLSLIAAGAVGMAALTAGDGNVVSKSPFINPVKVESIPALKSRQGMDAPLHYEVRQLFDEKIFVMTYANWAALGNTLDRAQLFYEVDVEVKLKTNGELSQLRGKVPCLASGYDLPLEVAARFFTAIAYQTEIKLNQQENQFLADLLAAGLLIQNEETKRYEVGQKFAGTMLIGISVNTSEATIAHEIDHAVLYLEEAYGKEAQALWQGLTDQEKLLARQVTLVIANIANENRFVIKEWLAYLHQPDELKRILERAKNISSDSVTRDSAEEFLQNKSWQMILGMSKKIMQLDNHSRIYKRLTTESQGHVRFQEYDAQDGPAIRIQHCHADGQSVQAGKYLFVSTKLWRAEALRIQCQAEQANGEVIVIPDPGNNVLIPDDAWPLVGALLLQEKANYPPVVIYHRHESLLVSVALHAGAKKVAVIMPSNMEPMAVDSRQNFYDDFIYRYCPSMPVVKAMAYQQVERNLQEFQVQNALGIFPVLNQGGGSSLLPDHLPGGRYLDHIFVGAQEISLDVKRLKKASDDEILQQLQQMRGFSNRVLGRWQEASPWPAVYGGRFYLAYELIAAQVLSSATDRYIPWLDPANMTGEDQVQALAELVKGVRDQYDELILDGERWQEAIKQVIALTFQDMVKQYPQILSSGISRKDQIRAIVFWAGEIRALIQQQQSEFQKELLENLAQLFEGLPALGSSYLWQQQMPAVSVERLPELLQNLRGILHDFENATLKLRTLYWKSHGVAKSGEGSPENELMWQFNRAVNRALVMAHPLRIRQANTFLPGELSSVLAALHGLFEEGNFYLQELESLMTANTEFLFEKQFLVKYLRLLLVPLINPTQSIPDERRLLDINQCLDDLIRVNRIFYKDSGVNFEIDRGRQPLWINGSEVVILRTIENLIKNSLRAIEQGSFRFRMTDFKFPELRVALKQNKQADRLWLRESRLSPETLDMLSDTDLARALIKGFDRLVVSDNLDLFESVSDDLDRTIEGKTIRESLSDEVRMLQDKKQKGFKLIVDERVRLYKGILEVIYPDGIQKPQEKKNLKQVTLEVRQQNQQVEILIKDTGAGIAPQDLSRIFTPFFTTKEGPESATSGQGLSIVKKMIESQGGIIKVSSEVGKGTTFTIRLPVDEAKIQAADIEILVYQAV